MDTHRDNVRFEFGSASDVGRKRQGEPNQDALEVVLPDSRGDWHPPLLIIADGMGGHFGGATASRLVVQTFKQEFQQAKHPANYPFLLDHCAHKAHRAVRERGGREPQLENMGSTIVAVVLDAENLYQINVGDSRAYVLNRKQLTQISQDQTWVAEQVRAGILSEQEARGHPNRNRLNMAITARRTEIKPYIAEKKMESNDIVVLCSDGLWGVVPESLIGAVAGELDPQAAAKKLVALANSSQGPDNISVIIARRYFPSNMVSVTSGAD